jgi:acyl-CoA synthetase (AMP-forming)/AMP-acid ligase II
MRGLMQEVPLTIELVLGRLERHSGPRHVVTGTREGSERFTWEEIGERVGRLRGVLRSLGVERGQRVGTFARNTHRHLELLLGVPAEGAVLAPVNIRLFEDQVAYVVAHAETRVMFVDAGLTGVLAPLRERLEGVEAFVVMDDGEEVAPEFAGDPRYEELLAAEGADAGPVRADEGDALAICYTSGTTGNPKGVVFSHRSTALHTISLLMVDNHALSRADVLFPITAVCHVLAWCLPYAAGLAGCDLVFQGPSNDPEHLARLIDEERVTTAAAVPTVWVEMERLFDEGERDLSSMRELLIGGAPVPRALIRRYRERGITIAQGWGMTEMPPSGTMSRETGDGEGASKQGQAMALVELRLMGEDGRELPWDGESVGELEVRGPCVARAYYEPDDPAAQDRFRDGWLRTGDLARLDPDGTVEIVDRAKDLVKSGGEWISSVELENAIHAHPDVREAAVIAVPHPKWDERPLAVVVLRPGATVAEGDLAGFLRDRVAKWWIPESFEFVDQIPRTAVGKYDKKLMRERYRDHARSTV